VYKRARGVYYIINGLSSDTLLVDLYCKKMDCVYVTSKKQIDMSPQTPHEQAGPSLTLNPYIPASPPSKHRHHRFTNRRWMAQRSCANHQGWRPPLMFPERYWVRFSLSPQDLLEALTLAPTTTEKKPKYWWLSSRERDSLQLSSSSGDLFCLPKMGCN
jgi:hypothetical protein